MVLFAAVLLAAFLVAIATVFAVFLGIRSLGGKGGCISGWVESLAETLNGTMLKSPTVQKTFEKYDETTDLLRQLIELQKETNRLLKEVRPDPEQPDPGLNKETLFLL